MHGQVYLAHFDNVLQVGMKVVATLRCVLFTFLAT